MNKNLGAVYPYKYAVSKHQVIPQTQPNKE